MSFKVFYCRYRDDFEQSTPGPLATEEIREFAMSILESTDDFFGVVDPAGTTFQIMLENGRYWIEIPRPESNGSYGTHVDRATVVAILDDLPLVFDDSMVRGGKFQVW